MINEHALPTSAIDEEPQLQASLAQPEEQQVTRKYLFRWRSRQSAEGVIVLSIITFIIIAHYDLHFHIEIDFGDGCHIIFMITHHRININSRIFLIQNLFEYSSMF